MPLRSYTFLVIALALAPLAALGNNVQIQNLQLLNHNSGSQQVFIQFNISWENSWKLSSSPANWDAVWVFAKYREFGGDWQHVNLNNATWQSPHVVPAGCKLDPVPDGRGVFLSRNQVGTGNVNWNQVQLRWDYAPNQLVYSNLAEIRVYAIEMVYVPTGPFTAGTGGTGTAEFTKTLINTAAANQNPYWLGNGYAGGYPQNQVAPNPSWPNGYNAFYCMKYEISEHQWVEFFNTLTHQQKLERDITGRDSLIWGKATDSVDHRCTIAWHGRDATTSAPDRACGWLGWADGLAYLDWAGLRPMTELEFEKACRGPIAPRVDEYAWGNTFIKNWTQYSLSNAGTPQELIAGMGANSGNANHTGTDLQGQINGPVRCGIFAASIANPTRTEAGATYYGIMEMSGNLVERAVSIGFPQGRAFVGSHGDGSITANGMTDESDWPDPVLGFGSALRGGSFANGDIRIRVSDRFENHQPHIWRLHWRGWRGVRTAP